jgi:hypothetical protein
LFVQQQAASVLAWLRLVQHPRTVVVGVGIGEQHLAPRDEIVRDRRLFADELDDLRVELCVFLVGFGTHRTRDDQWRPCLVD